LKQTPFFEAAMAEVKIGSSLKPQGNLTKFKLVRKILCTIAPNVKPKNPQLF
jgi:hypothetical protein